MAELDEGRSRDHGPKATKAAEATIAPEAPGCGREPDPDRPRAFDRAGERAVVDDLVADHTEAAGPTQRGGADEDASACASSGARSRIVDLRERIELLEEEHERRDQEPLPGRPAPQHDHERDEIEALGLGLGDEASQLARVMLDVGVGEEHVPRVGHALGAAREPLLQRPELAGPARLQRTSRDQIEPAVPAGGRARGIGGPVLAGVVHHHQEKGRRIVLAEKRGDAAGDRPRLVARGHHRQHRGPRDGPVDLGEALIGAPETVAANDKVDPHGQRARTDEQQADFAHSHARPLIRRRRSRRGHSTTDSPRG